MNKSTHKKDACKCGGFKRASAKICRKCLWRTPDIRFHSSYEKTDSCWNWTQRTLFGYGYFSFRGKSVRAHRFSWELVNGPIPGDLCVCHSCDNRRCVNPSHLWLGTRNDNIQDCKNKHRLNRARHEAHSQAKLSMEKAGQIRLLYSGGGMTQASLAKMFSVGGTAIERIIKNKTWVNT